MRNLVILMSASGLAACSGGGAETVNSVSTNTPASTGTTTTTASTDTFVAPTTTKTYQSAGAVQSYTYDYTEVLGYTKDQVFSRQAVVDANGAPVLDGAGNPTYQNVAVLDSLGQPTYALNKDSRTLLDYGQGAQLYAANATTVRSPSVTITYDPRNAQFTLKIADPAISGLTNNITFQDPAHRTDFDGLRKPQSGVPNLEVGDPAVWRTKGVQYLQVDTGSNDAVYDVSTFFYDLPNAQTHQYVTFAGFVRNHYEKPIETVVTDGLRSQVTTAKRKTKLDRAAFVYGQQTLNADVPKTGTATYTGGMIASMVNNPLFDTDPYASTYFQWLSGTATVGVDFANGNITTALSGTTLAPMLDSGTSAYSAPLFLPTAQGTVPLQGAYIPAGAIFSAAGTGKIDLVATGGFTGTFSSAQFTFGSTIERVDIVGSTLDGAFYGPKGEEIGASFRIVGGIPDQRVDIIGAFTGKKP